MIYICLRIIKIYIALSIIATFEWATSRENVICARRSKRGIDDVEDNFRALGVHEYVVKCWRDVVPAKDYRDGRQMTVKTLIESKIVATPEEEIAHLITFVWMVKTCSDSGIAMIFCGNVAFRKFFKKNFAFSPGVYVFSYCSWARYNASGHRCRCRRTTYTLHKTRKS